MGPSWPPGSLLGASWGLLGASLGLSGPSWGHPGHNVSQPYLLAPLFDRSWALWGRFGALLGPSWDPFGALWGLSWASWGAPGPLLGLFWGPTWVHAWMYAFIACPLPLPMAWHISLSSYRRVYAKLCRTHFSRSLPHCLSSSLQPLMQFILAPASPSFDRYQPYENIMFSYGFCTLWLLAFSGSSSPVLRFMTLSCVRVSVDGLLCITFLLLQGISKTVLHTFLPLDAQLYSITLSSPNVS